MNTVAQAVQIYEQKLRKNRSVYGSHRKHTGPCRMTDVCRTMWWWAWSSMWSCAWAVGRKQLMPRKWLGRLVSVLEEELVEMSKRRSLKILSIVDDPGRARVTDWSPQQWKAQCCTTEHGRRSFPAVAVRLYDSSLFNQLKHFKNLHMHISTLISYSIHLFFTRWED